MNRREAIILGAGVAIWPSLARAQAPNVPVVGFLNVRSAAETEASVLGFSKGLAEAGFVEGRNVAFEFRWANGNYDRLPAYATELVRRNVSVLATGGGPASALAAKAATSTIPIVFMGGSDPVGSGLVASFSRPGGNITGVLNVASELTAKRLEILPDARSIGVLRNPGYAEAAMQIQEAESAAARMGVKLHMVTASSERDFEPALAEFTRQRVSALLVANDPYFAAQRANLIPLVARYRLPAIYSQREYVEAGGLMSYGTNFAELYRQAGGYIGRILKGEKPADLPVTQPARFELVIHRKTASALGIEIPNKLVALADEVID